MDPFQIPIQIFRKAGYTMPVSLAQADGSAFPTDGYTFRLEISPTRSDSSWAPPAFAQQNLAGSGSSGTVFVLSDDDTDKLSFVTAYNWRVLVQAADALSPAALIGGSCTVLDGPAMPIVNPPPD